jgi:uncharacterized OB-fold protein
MSTPLMIAICERCGHAAHPPRVLCPVCAGSGWRRERGGGGVVEEVTWLDGAGESSGAHARRLAAVRLERGPRVIARLATGVEAGDRVSLEMREGKTIAEPLAAHPGGQRR